MSSSGKLSAVVCSTCLSLLSGPAAGQGASCFGPTRELAAASAGPAWWDEGSPAPLGTETERWIDDPRWEGAHGWTTTFDHVRLRGLVETVGEERFLILMWHVKQGPLANDTAEESRLYFGFADDTLGSRYAFEVRPRGTTSTTMSGSTDYDAFFYSWNPDVSEWEELAFPPLWLTETGRLDRFCDPNCTEWAFRVRARLSPEVSFQSIPMTSTGDYKFFFQVRDNASGGAPLYSHPTGFDVTTSKSECAIGPFCVSHPTTWSAFVDSEACAGDISLRAGDVYAGTPGNLLASLNEPNVIHARPTNLSGGPLNNDSIRAKFRFAHQPSSGTTPPRWETLACAGADAEGYVTGAAGVVAAGEAFDLACDWSVPDEDKCAYEPAGHECGPEAGTLAREQPLLVELATAPGTPNVYFFAPQSLVTLLELPGGPDDDMPPGDKGSGGSGGTDGTGDAGAPGDPGDPGDAGSAGTESGGAPGTGAGGAGNGGGRDGDRLETEPPRSGCQFAPGSSTPWLHLWLAGLLVTGRLRSRRAQQSPSCQIP